MIRFIKSLANEDGQAVVELAITIPLLLVILGGIIDFGWIYTNQSAVDHCAREGARYAIVHATDTDAVANIIKYTKALAPSRTADTMTVSVVFSNAYKPRAGNVTILVKTNVRVLTPVVGVFTGGQVIGLNSSCVMKVE